MKSGKSDTSINAPTDTKNKAANISLIGVARTLETECDFDLAINTPAKKAPAATDIPSWYAILDRPKTKAKITITSTC